MDAIEIADRQGDRHAGRARQLALYTHEVGSPPASVVFDEAASIQQNPSF